MKTVLGDRKKKPYLPERIKRIEDYANKRKPVKTKPNNMIGSLFAKRNKRLAIREASLRKVSVVLTYEKIETNEIKKYEVIPMSYRTKKLKTGWRKVLYAQDVSDDYALKMFVLRNIKKVAITDKKIKPSGGYEVEIQ